MLIGRLGRDPEFRMTQTGVSCVRFSLATTTRGKSKATNEYEEQTQWHYVEAWKSQADFVDKYCKKGTLVYVEGEIRHEKYKDKHGVDKQTTKIVGWTVRKLSYDEVQQTQQSKSYTSPSAQVPTPKPAPQSVDDDIPF